MAGSYDHCCYDNGEFLNNEDFPCLIENLGDAYEACEMMHWMINHLAGGNRGKIKQAEKAYFDFVRKQYKSL